MPPEQNSPAPMSSGANNDKVFAILSYLGILVLVPLLVSQNRSSFLNHHINQGLGLIIVSVIGWIGLSFIGMWQLMNVWQLLILILVIIGIINASKNEMKVLPVIGNWFHLIK